jgi:Raf kinase inhibitor-like YbhB/YbcL family protein
MATLSKTTKLTIGSPAFGQKDFIPPRYTCEGENISPEITIEGLTEEAKSIAIIVDDPDAPNGTFDHWIQWNIKPTNKIPENASPGVEGKNSFGHTSYGGPCPPSGVHRYFFKVYALDIILDIPSGSDKIILELAMKNHIAGKGELIGLYKKSSAI